MTLTCVPSAYMQQTYRVRSCVRSSVRSFVRPFVRPFFRSFVRSFAHSFVRSSIRPFAHSFVREASPFKSPTDATHPVIIKTPAYNRLRVIGTCTIK